MNAHHLRFQRNRALASILISFFFLLRSPCAAPLSFQQLKEMAIRTANAPFVAASDVATNWTALSYVQYSAIRFRSEHALWSSSQSPFLVHLMHPGYVHRQTVDIALVDDGQTQEVPFSSDLFDYGPIQPSASPPGGFAGFKMFSRERGMQEVGAFIGASYFRMVGFGQAYGLSARGLALDVTGSEEFPAFRRFWLKRPDPHAQEAVAFAILDSPRVAGAFEFCIRPGVESMTRVRAFLQPRMAVTDPGLAPLTSMFLHDDNGRALYSDFRPEVHDSDGLLMELSNGRWIWRPLDKGIMIRANAYGDVDPKGFGLLQRDRNFSHYDDPLARFERRPSAWIQPAGKWGKGSVVLVQLPSDREFSDNVVAYWRPERGLEEGQSYEYAYTIQWTTNRILPESLAQVSSSRVGKVIVEPPAGPPNLRFVVDFTPGSRTKLNKDSRPEHEVVVGQGAEIVAESLYFVEESQSWRLVIETTQPTRAVDLQAVLRIDRETISEYWNFTWQP